MVAGRLKVSWVWLPPKLNSLPPVKGTIPKKNVESLSSFFRGELLNFRSTLESLLQLAGANGRERAQELEGI